MRRQRPAGTQPGELGRVQPRTEPSRSAARDDSASPRGQHVRHTAMRHPAQRPAGASSRTTVRGKSRPSQGETQMRKKAKNNAGSTGNSSGESHEMGSSPKFELSVTEEAPIRIRGLACVPFDLVRSTHPSITVEVGQLTSFEQLRDMEGMPDPTELQLWLIADNVLIECGDFLGLVPDVRYVQAGLFLRHVCQCRCCDEEATVTVKLTPKGVMWVKKHYVPTPERHRVDFVPEDLRGPID